MLGDAGAGHERRGGLAGHLRPVIGQRDQHRQPVIALGDLPGRELGEQVVIKQLLLAVGDQRPGEGDLHLGGGLFRGHDGGQPVPGHHIQDRDRAAFRPGEVGEVVDPDHPGHQLGPLRPGPGRARLARRG